MIGIEDSHVLVGPVSFAVDGVDGLLDRYGLGI